MVVSDGLNRERAAIEFTPSAEHTLGVEWEISLVDHRTTGLTSQADVVFDALDGTDHRLKPEMLRNMVELVTGVCHTVPEAMADLAASMNLVRSVIDDLGIGLFSAGMHPFSPGPQQLVTQKDRYFRIVKRTQYWGQQLTMTGIHVHVGMPDVRRVFPVINSFMRFYPLLQAVSAASPFYEGHDTGYASNRSVLFRQLPTAGPPFQFDSWPEYQEYVEDLRTTGVIEEINQIYWDVRPSPAYGTIEVRACDSMSTFEQVAAVTALTHCLIVDLDDRAAAGEDLPTLHPWHVEENKWRSARYAMDADVIVDKGNHEAPVRDEIARLAEELAPVAERLGCANELAGLEHFLRSGADYQRHRSIATAPGGNLRTVVRDSVHTLAASLDRQMRLAA